VCTSEPCFALRRARVTPGDGALGVPWAYTLNRLFSTSVNLRTQIYSEDLLS